MPHGSTKFQASWLCQTDVDGQKIGNWCTSCKTSKYKAYCTLCMKEFSIENSGLTQIQQHAKGEKHRSKSKAKYSHFQRHFILSGNNSETSRESQGPVSILTQDMSLQEKVITAESLWAIKTASSDYSFASSDGTPQLFQKMFPGDVSDNFTMSRTKASYMISDGLGPYFKKQLCQDIVKSDVGYTIQFDETGNSQGRKQCDILIRYWSQDKNEISVRFLQTLFFGHAKGHDVAKKIIETLQDSVYQLPLSGLISLSSDGPNVNKTIWSSINELLLGEGLPGLMPFIPCNIHVVHNAFRAGINAYGEASEELAIDLFYWLKSSPCRREDYIQVLNDLELNEDLFIRHVQCRWLTLIPAIDRIVKKWEAIKKYFLEELPKIATEERTFATLQKNERYNRICRKLQEKSFPAQLAFLLSVEPIFKKFLCFFQSEGPLIHLLRNAMCELLKSMMGRFLKSQALKDKEGKHLLTVEYSKRDNQLSLSQIEVGETTRSLLSKLPTDQQKTAILGMKQFYMDTTKYLVGHLPIDNKLLRDVSFLHPLLRNSEHGPQAIRRLAVMMPTVSEEEVSLVTDEWRVYQVEDVNADNSTCRLDHYWADVFKEKSQQGEVKYPVLQKLIKSLLSLAHGNADVERSLSANKKTVTPDRASLADLTINGLRSVKDHVKVCGASQNVQITKGLLDASRQSYKAYAKRLSDEKEEMAKKKRIQESEQQRLREVELEREKQADRLETNRQSLCEKEKELVKSEEQKDSELQTAKTLYQEANERLLHAIKDKNFSEAAIAQGLLEIAEKKMQHAMEETQRCSVRRTELAKQKKRLLEGYSKHMSAKKRKD